MAMNCNGNCVENRNIVFFYVQIEQENEKIERKRVKREGVRIYEKKLLHTHLQKGMLCIRSLIVQVFVPKVGLG